MWPVVIRQCHQSAGEHMNARVRGIIAGVVTDRLLPDPQHSWHPVAVYGAYASWLEGRLHRDDRRSGILFLAAAVIPPVVVSAIAHRRWPAATTAATLWSCLGGSLLERTGTRMADHLEADRVEQARELVPWLCSRDPELLDAPGIARATVESLAENTSDAAVASLFWAGMAGAPGVVAHRCINTLDAMVGYRNDRYRDFGWAAARMDDLAAWVPARLTALIHTGLAGVEGRSGEAVRAWRKDAPRHPSPNAGPVEATAAAALGVTLGGATIYAHGAENRPRMGRGPAPVAGDVRRAVSLSRTTQIASAAVAAGLAMVGGRRR
ncbi:putative cobalamin biosynthesis protein D [Corynebacterium efficiens YS-314]|uniref:Cobalamin biosynthesis protein CobD n=2 Tax=Corynebacterium efficiens TaxID=152794 RepID=Q8FNK4_COREF|nr:putative cobalamin biosynthesis protein D [Corynebacterium efficiens YS-314]